MPSGISQYLETRTLFLGHHSPTHASVEDCPQGMHQDLMFIPRKGTRRGLASRGKALVQLAALPNQRSHMNDQGATNHAGCWPITRAWHNTTGLFKTLRDPFVIDNAVAGKEALSDFSWTPSAFST